MLKMSKDKDAQSDQEFIGKIRAFRELEFLNIKNPEYVLNLIAEDLFTTMIQNKDEGNSHEIEALKGILAAAQQVQRKIQNMDIRLDLLEHATNTSKAFVGVK